MNTKIKSLFAWMLCLCMFSFTHVEASQISGTITDATSNSRLSGVSVNLELLGLTVATTTTNTSGAYTFPNLLTGDYTVTASLSGYQTASSNVLLGLVDNNTTNFQLLPQGGLSGTITNSLTSAPIVGAAIQVLQGSTVIASTISSATGTYSLSNLNPGSYTLSVTATNYGSNTQSITIASNVTSPINVALQPLFGAITGTVTDAITSLALPGVTINVLNGSTVVATTTTNSSGVYTIAQLVPGTSSVSASLANYQTSTPSVNIVANQTTTQNIALTPQNGTLAGTVLDNVSGLGLQGVSISVLNGITVVATTTTNSSGQYSISSLPPGAYTLQASLLNYQTATSSPTVLSNQTTTANISLQPLPGAVTGLVLNLESLLSLSGATVNVLQGNNVIATTTTNALGIYLISGLNPGNYTLSISAANFTTVTQPIAVAANLTLTVNISLPAASGTVTGIVANAVTSSVLSGVTVSALQGSTVIATTTTNSSGVYTLTVAPGSYTIQSSLTNYVTQTDVAVVVSNLSTPLNILLQPISGFVSGQITNAQTLAGISGATVQLLQGNTPVGTATTNSIGAYSISGVVPNVYTLSASATNFSSTTQPVIALSNQTVTANAALQPQAGILSGIVTDSTTSTGISGAVINVMQGNVIVATGTSTSNGSYSISNLIPGSYSVVTSALNYVSVTSTATIQSNLTTTLNSALQPQPGAISGLITNASTLASISGATVSVLQAGSTVASTTTNALGIYTISGLLPGNYSLSVNAPNYTTVIQPETIISNLTTPANLALSPQSGTLSGQIKNSTTSAVISGATITVSQGNTTIASATSDVNGNYSISVAPGNYTVSITVPNFQPVNSSATILSDAATSLNGSLLPQTGTVAGTILNNLSLPLSGATISALQGTTVVATTTTNLLGAYTLSLAPGNYTIQAASPNFQTSTQSASVASNVSTPVNLSLSLQPGTISGTLTNITNSNPIGAATIQVTQGATSIATTTTSANGSYTVNNLVPGTYTVTATATNFQTGTLPVVVVTSNNTTSASLALIPQTGSIAGTVTDSSTAAPLVGATVSALQNSVVIASTITDANGDYTLSSLAPGSYNVRFSFANYQTATQSATVSSNQITTLNAQLLASPGSIAGSVVNATTLAPISGATVTVLEGSNVIASTTTNALGTYSITGLAPASSGIYTFRASATNFQTNTQTAAIVANQTTTVPFSLLQQPGTLTGTVSSSTGGPVAGAAVQIFLGTALVSSTTSDVNGLYTVSGLAPAVYSVNASATNYQAAIQGATITAGQTTTLNVSLQPAPGSITGQIIDATTSNPIDGALINVYQGSTFITSTLSNVSGSYTLLSLPAGNYNLSASAAGYQSTTVSATILPNQTSTINLSLQAQPGIISGLVIDATTLAPLSGATVSILLGNTMIASATTQSNGTYSIGNVAPGSYTVTASLSNYQTGTQGAAVVANLTTIENFALQSQPGAVSGLVFDSSTLAPINDATVQVLRSALVIASTTTNSSGNYSISGLAPGSYTISAGASNYQILVEGLQIQAGATTTANLNLAAQPGSVSGSVKDASTLTGIVGAVVSAVQGSNVVASVLTDINGNYAILGLSPGSYALRVNANTYQSSIQGVTIEADQNVIANVLLQSLPGALTGLVENISSNPIAGALIDIYQGTIHIASALTGSTGNYSVPNLAPGAYTVNATATNFQIATQGVVILPSVPASLNFILLGQPGAIAGTITDAVSSQPIAGGIVSILQGSNVIASAITGFDGSYAIQGLGAGSYTLRVSATNYQTATLGAMISANVTDTVNVQLQSQTGTIAGQASDFLTGTVIVGATVDIFQNSTLMASTLTDNNGNFSVPNLAPGTYLVSISATNYQTATAAVIVLPTQTTTINLQLAADPGSITGLVTDAVTHNPITGASLVISTSAGIPVGTAFTNASGNYTLTGLAAGNYSITASDANYQTLQQGLTIAQNATTTVNIQLHSASSSITGTIIDRTTSAVIAGATVTILQNSLPVAFTLTDSAGVYVIPNLAPGNYSIRVGLTNYATLTQGVILPASTALSLNLGLEVQIGLLTCLVKDASTLLPLADALVVVSQAGTTVATTVTDLLGNCTLNDLAPGVYQVVTSLAGYQSSILSVTIQAGVTANLDISLLSNPGNVSGVVISSATSSAIPGATVSVYQGNALITSTLTDANGAYLINGLSTGSYTVVASALNYQSEIQGALILAGQTSILNFALAGQPGILSGQVTDAATSLPLAGATVIVMENNMTVATALTDVNGNYSFNNLAAANYTVAASATNYATALKGATVSANTTTTLNFALQSQPGSITGTVIDALTLQPIPGAHITVLQNASVITSGLTGPDGAYSILGCAPGSYVVLVSASSYQSISLPCIVTANVPVNVDLSLMGGPGSIAGTVVDRTTSNPIAGASITLMQGSNFIASAITNSSGQYQLNNLSPGQYTISAGFTGYQTSTTGVSVFVGQQTAVNFSLLTQPGTLTGSVVDSSSNPISGATITLIHGTTEITSTQSSSTGSFTITGLAPGNYTVRASDTNYQTETLGVTITANQTSTLTLVLQSQPGSISGTVIATATSTPIADAQIDVLANNAIIASTETDASGNYQITGLASGSYQVRVTATGYQTVLQGAIVQSGATTTVNFSLAQTIGTITGQVTDANTGNVIPSAALDVFQGSFLLASAISDSNGNFTIANLAPGSYTLRVGATDYQTVMQAVTIQANQTTTVNIALSQGPGSVSGQVTDALTAQPIAGAAISIALAQGNAAVATVFTDSSGQYLISGLAPGSYTATASASNYQTLSQGVSVQTNITTTSNFALQSNPGALSGLITDQQTSLGIPNAEVDVVQNNTVILSTLSDSQGHYQLTGLAAGSYSVRASAANYQTATAAANVQTGATTILNIALAEQPGSLSAQVTDEFGNPLAGATVQVSVNGNSVATVLTNASGNAVLNGLAPGTYSVSASFNNYQTAVTSATIHENQTTSITLLLLAQPGTVSGQVVDAVTTLPIASATLTLLQGSNAITTVLTDNSGSYSITGLAPGNYTLRASANNYQTALQGITVQSNTITTANFSLQSNPGAVSGIVTGTLTNPIANATVEILQGSNVIATTMTDVNGNYTLSNLAPGSYTLRVQATNYQTAVQGVTIVASQTVIDNFVLTANPGSISGTVTDSVTLQAISNVQISVIQNSSVIATATTNGSGQFTVSGLTPGNYSVTASATNYQTQSQGATVVANQSTQVNFSLADQPGTVTGSVTDAVTTSPIQGAQVNLVQGSLVIASSFTDSNGSFTFSGLAPANYTAIVTASGYQNAILGVNVQSNQTTSLAFALNAQPGTITGTVTAAVLSGITIDVLQDNTIVATTVTDSSGAFTISNLAPGSYIVRASAPNLQTATQGAVVQAATTTTIAFTLQSQPGSISGIVTDLATSLPIASASVSVLQDNNLIATSVTASDGSYSISGLASGSYNVRVSARNYGTAIVGAVVTSPQTTIVDVELQSLPGSVTGQITSVATGSSLPGAAVDILSGANLIASTFTDSNGLYSISGLSAGTYLLRVSLNDYQVTTQSVIIQASQATTANVALLSQTGTLSGVITDAITHNPITGASVSVAILQGNIPIVNVLTDSNGNYTATGLAPGNYTISVSAANYQTVSSGITIVENITTLANFALMDQPGTVTGIVTDGITQNPLAGVSVSISQGGITITSVLTNSSGSFLINNLAPGTYQITASSPNYEQMSVTVEIVANQTTISNIALGTNPGSISGRVLDAISGMGIAGANVTLQQGSNVISYATTDSNGAYSIAGLGAGNYTAIASKINYQSQIISATVAAGTATTVNFSLSSEPASVSGTVFDASNNPIANATISIFLGNSLVVSTYTDVNGAYAINNLPAASYIIRAEANTYQIAQQGLTAAANQAYVANFILQSAPGSISGQITDATSLNPIANANIDILEGNILIASTTSTSNGGYFVTGLPSGQYTIRVTAPSYPITLQGVTIVAPQTATANIALSSQTGNVTGQITDFTTLQPIANAFVNIQQNNTVLASAITDSDGNYAFEDLAAGDYVVVVNATNYQAAYQGVTIQHALTSIVNIALNSQAGQISGQVTGTNHTPLPGSQVNVFLGTTLITTLLTDANGNYITQGLAPGNYTIQASAPDYVTGVQGAIVVANQTTSLNFNLQSLPGTVNGSVTDTSDAPLAGVTVQVYQDFIPIASTTSDQNGSYSIHGLAPGSYTVLFSLTNYQTLSQAALVVNGQTTTLNAVLLTPAVTLSGSVVDAVTLNPIAGATIRLSQMGAFIGSVISAHDGTFSLGNLAPGTYLLTTSSNNYQTLLQSVVLPAGQTTQVVLHLSSAPGSVSGQLIDASTGLSLANATVDILLGPWVISTILTGPNGNYLINGLAPNNYTLRASDPNYQTLLQGVLVQSAQNTIANMALFPSPGTVTGMIQNSSAQPVANAQISVLSGNILVASATSSPSGQFQITGLAVGNYIINVSATNLSTAYQSIVIQANSTTTADFTLESSPGSIAGMVSDATTAAPIAGAQVKILSGNVNVAWVLTNADGQYSITGLAAGTYTIEAVAPNYQTLIQAVTIQANQVTTTNLALQSQPATITGRVIDALSLNPIIGAQITILQSNSAIATLVTDQNGFYTAYSLSSVPYTIIASANNYQSEIQDLSVPAGQTATLNFALNASPAAITGTVTDANQVAVSNATVNVLRNGMIIASTQTNAQGSFTISGLSAGSFTVNASAPNLQTSTQSLSLQAGVTTTVHFILLSSPGAIQGSVIDGPTSQPILGATVNIGQLLNVISSVLTDSQGNYFAGGLPPGQYTAVASAPNHQSETLGAIVVSGASTTANFILELQPGTIIGTILNGATSQPIADAIITLTQNGTLIASTTSDTSGQFSIGSLASGAYIIIVSAPNYPVTAQSVVVTANQTTTANFTIGTASGSVFGQVVNTNNQPLPGATVIVTEGSIILVSTMTDQNGNYVIPALTPQNYTISVSDAQYQNATQGITVLASTSTALNFTLQSSPGAITGSVVNSSAQPINGASVSILQGSQVVATAITSPTGQFTINGLAAGNYSVVVSAPGFQTSVLGVNIVANQTATASFVLHTETGSVTGTITSAATTLPLESALVSIYQGTILLESFLTPADGQYTFSNLAPGSYTLTAGASTYATAAQGIIVANGITTVANFALQSNPGSLQGIITDLNSGLPVAQATVDVLQGNVLIASGISDSNGNYNVEGLAAGNYLARINAVGYQIATASVTIQASLETTLNVSLATPVASVTGTVTDGTTLAPIPGATISISTLQGNTAIASTLTDVNGQYSISELAPGSYSITATASNYQTDVQGLSLQTGASVQINFVLQSQPGTISGIIANASTSQPVAGATVDVYQGQVLVASTLSNTQGAYLIANLAVGNYTVRVQAATYQIAVQGASVVAGQTTVVNIELLGSPGEIQGTVSDAITAHALAGAEVDVLQSNTLIASALTNASGQYQISSLAPGSYTIRASLTNYQTVYQGVTVVASQTTQENLALQAQPSTITGTITDATSGLPIAGASINLQQGSTSVMMGLSDSSGSYTFTGIAPGTYEIVVNATGYQAQMQGVTLQTNQTVTESFALQQNPATISGTITDAITMLPVAGATVKVLMGNTLINSTLSDTNGNFAFDGLAVATYTVTVSAAGYQTAAQTAITEAGMTTALTFMLSSAAGNAGTVSGQVTNSSANPLVGASVIVTQGPTQIASTLTDSNGNFTISNLAPGTYTLTISDPNHQTAVQTIVITANATTTANQVLASDPGSVAGFVMTTSNLPIAQASVTVYANSLAIASTTTNSQGAYSISGLAPGSYTMTASANGFQNVTLGVTIQSDVTLTNNFILPGSAGNLFGNVEDAVTLAPIANAAIAIMQNNVTVFTTSTDSSGNYLVTNLAPGSYIISITAPSYQILLAAATIVSGQTTLVDSFLQSNPGTLVGTVTDSGSNPLSNISIQVYIGMDLIATTLTNTSGNYTIANLPVGTINVVASGVGYSTTSQTDVILAGQTTTLDFTMLSEFGNVSGHVSDGFTGSPIPSASLSLFQGTTLLSSSLSDANGNYQINHLAPGAYTIRASFVNNETGTVNFNIVANQTTVVNIVLPALPGSIDGVVRDLTTGLTVAGASIIAFQNTIPIASTISDSVGFYMLSGLPPGLYVVQVTIPASSQSAMNVSRALTVTAPVAETQTFDVFVYPNTTTIQNIFIQASAAPPTGLTAYYYKDKFLTQTAYSSVLNWLPSASGDIVQYQIYKNGLQIATVAGNVLTYIDHTKSKKRTVYQVRALNSQGELSTPATAVLQNAHHHHHHHHH